MRGLTIFFLLISNVVWAQQNNTVEPYKNDAFIELLGNGGYASVNFERMVYHFKRYSVGISGGLSTFKLKDFEREFNPDVIAPFGARLYYGGFHHKIFAGVGQTLTSISKLNVETFNPQRVYHLSANFMLGYRYDFKRMLLQIAYTPIWSNYKQYYHWVGLAVGFKF